MVDIKWDLHALNELRCLLALLVVCLLALLVQKLDMKWDLRALIQFRCTPAPHNATDVPKPIKCQGDADTLTCGPIDKGATKCSKPAPSPPAKICFASKKPVKETVDVALWNRIYGTSPEVESCQFCFLLGVADRPFFVTTGADKTGMLTHADVC